jgi:S1-C subfamily serine protease
MAEKSFRVEKLILVIAVILLGFGAMVSSGTWGLRWQMLERFIPKFSINQPQTPSPSQNIRIVSEESIIIDVVDRTSPAVVTVSITQTQRVGSMFEFNPFDPFSPFHGSGRTTQKVEQDIGSGFIIDSNGLVVTNKHVVSDTQSAYRVITKDNKTYSVLKIYRDPANDLAILKINPPAGGLPVMQLGDSDKIKVGQLAIAIGTALGEFRSTVTTGVISGVGRGITAGDPMEGAAERLDNVIQTSAAINPGNSGGPLLNSSGQVIGINVAVSGEGQNIGFALPINVVKDAITNFNTTGQFNRPYLGVRYKIVTKDVAVLNEIPEGAYIMEVISGSPADKAGIKQDDIITKLDGVRLSGSNAELSKIIAKKKVGDTITLTVWRDGKEQTLNASLASQE